MATTLIPHHRFDPASLTALDEPVRRYLTHAIVEGSEVRTSAHLEMEGRIEVGRWLAFTAIQEVDGRSFSWRARAGWRGLKVAHVLDTYADGVGSTEGKLLGRVRFMHAANADTARSAAGRAAVERILAPGTLLPGPGVTWRAEADDVIVARLDVPPEHPELTLRIGETGAVLGMSILRWGDVGQEAHGYIPFGGTVSAERRFGGVVIPSRILVGWWFGTSRYKPFFAATILAAGPGR